MEKDGKGVKRGKKKEKGGNGEKGVKKEKKGER